MRYGLDPWNGFLKRKLQENRAINQKHSPSLYFLNAGLSKINISVTFFSIVGNTGDCCKNGPPVRGGAGEIREEEVDGRACLWGYEAESELQRVVASR